eukprot:GHVN01081469.1.p1 GENE.GHVN01081469.1~~GHVN01081469.1.p1  ORF type:complete len:120 (-),score=6.99 GHVN01081469.1:1188-1547(-)
MVFFPITFILLSCVIVLAMKVTPPLMKCVRFMALITGLTTVLVSAYLGKFIFLLLVGVAMIFFITAASHIETETSIIRIKEPRLEMKGNQQGDQTPIPFMDEQSERRDGRGCQHYHPVR